MSYMLFKNNSETLILTEFRCKQIYLGGRRRDKVPKKMTDSSRTPAAMQFGWPYLDCSWDWK